MAAQGAKTINLYYLADITLRDIPNSRYKLKLFVGSEAIELLRKDNRTWAPAQRPEVSPTTEMRMEIQMKRGHLPWAKKDQTSKEIDLGKLSNEYWTPKEHELTVTEVVIVGNHHYSLELQFSASATAESLDLLLKKLEGLLKEYSPMMSTRKERVMERSIKYGAVIAELNPVTKAVFGLASVTFELLKEQNKYDQMPLTLLDRLRRILPLGKKVADDIVCEETDILEKVIQQMFEVMQKVAVFSCDYVKRARTAGGPGYPEMIEEMDRELTRVIEDFNRAVDVEALLLAKRGEQELLLTRLKCVETSYDLKLCCMEGTRESLLTQIIAWATNESTKSNIYWIHGLPGIGKTSLAHSICERLHDQHHLAGAFFCQKDDANTSEPRNILPTLIYKLAEIFPPFRNTVANRLRNDPNLTSKSMKDSLFLDFIRDLPRHPKHALVFVIDALDECGDDRSRPVLLKVLTGVATHAPWLKIIITSRPEVDIQRFFSALTQPNYSSHDLATDQEASADLRTFAQTEFRLVAEKWSLSTPWPEAPLFDGVISRANGLFIFIKTVVLALEHCKDPEESLRAALQDSDGIGVKSLYGLYSNILKARIMHDDAEFRQMIGVLLTTAPHRPLGEETIAELARVKVGHVRKWVNDLSSLLYRDEGANGGIRVRHLSISDFFVSKHAYQVNLQDANVQLGISCLRTMVEQLRFNTCRLEDSRLANKDVKDLPSRIKENISDPLQYSSLYWSDHLCFTPDNGNRGVWRGLKEFFEGLCPIFWIEVLSIVGMVPAGAPSLRRVIAWAEDADSVVLKRIQDICRFVIFFHTPISISAPHTYISTGPFLPSESSLSTIFTMQFPKAIKMQRGKLSSWPAPPSRWIGHAEAVSCVRYSPTGCHIVTASNDKTIRIWDAETGAVVGEPLKGHTDSVHSVAYSPNGRHIISGSCDGTIRIWDADTGATVVEPIEGHTDWVWSVAYSPDGRYIISGSDDRTIRIWDAETGDAVGNPLEKHTGHVRSVAYSLDGRYIISGSDDRTVRIWDAGTGATVGKPLEGHTGHVWSVAYSPDGQHIISGSDDKTIRIWDAKTGAAVGKPLRGHTDAVHSVAYSPDGHRILSGSHDRTIRVWDAATGAPIGNPLEGHSHNVYSVAYSPSGQHIISGSGDMTFRMWDARAGVAAGSPLEGHTSIVQSVAYSPDGRHIISGSGDRTIRIWDAETGAAVGHPLKGHTGIVRCVAYSPNGQHIISGSQDTTIRIWDAGTGVVVGSLQVGQDRGVNFIAYSPNGQHIISGSGGAIHIWDAKTGAAVGKPLVLHTNVVWSAVYSPDGRHIISGSSDKTIRIWDAETGAAVGKPLEGHTGRVWSVAYSPDGQHIISGSDDKTIRIWDAKTGAAVGKPLEVHTDFVRTVAYSPSGSHIISGSGDNTIQIWDAKTGAALGKPLKGHFGGVRSIGYSPDGQHFVSGSRDGTIHVWDSSPHVSTQRSTSRNAIHADLCAQPDAEGWVRDSKIGLLYWVPPDCRIGLHSPALLTIPPISHTRSISLDFEDFAFGTSWAQIFEG